MKKAQQNLTETDPQHIHETFSHNQDPKQTIAKVKSGGSGIVHFTWIEILNFIMDEEASRVAD